MLKKLRDKNLHTWVKGYGRHLIRNTLTRGSRKRHLLFALCDHYEPLWGKPSHDIGVDRVEAWRSGYPKSVRSIRDANGRPPRHSFFFPGEEYAPEYLDKLADLCARDFGEVEVHLHHNGDTSVELQQSLPHYLGLFAEHGHISKDKNDAFQYAFIHGNWSLANGRPDRQWCGVDDELEILFESGCYADFTFPSAPDVCQPDVVNQHFWPMGDLSQRRPYDKSERAQVGCFYDDRLLMMTGPLALNRRGRGIRIESAAIDASDPPLPSRIDSWVDANIHIAKRPEWVFVKVHTHGAPEDNANILLGPDGHMMHEYLNSRYNDGDRWVLHYVTAREMYNVARAAMEGQRGNPNQYFDYAILPPPVAG